MTNPLQMIEFVSSGFNYNFEDKDAKMRKSKILLIGLISLCFLFDAVGVSAQTKIDVFWKKFKAAVTKKDKSAVAAMSKLPVSMPYGVRSVKTKAEFLRRYNEIFYGEADAAKCFKTSPLNKVSATRYEVSCGFRKDTIGDGGEPLVYTFELTKSGWKFTSFDNINE